jgi:hypothetical protein
MLNLILCRKTEQNKTKRSGRRTILSRAWCLLFLSISGISHTLPLVSLSQVTIKKARHTNKYSLKEPEYLNVCKTHMVAFSKQPTECNTMRKINYFPYCNRWSEPLTLKNAGKRTDARGTSTGTGGKQTVFQNKIKLLLIIHKIYSRPTYICVYVSVCMN